MTGATDDHHDGLPGHVLIWVLIASEILVFSVALVGFLVMRLLHADAFRASAHLLHAGAGTMGMIVLLTSGYAAALAQDLSRKGSVAGARLGLLVAAALGLVFLVLKFAEYRDLWLQGVALEGNPFFTLYALITGFHAAHVVFGVALLTLVATRPKPQHVEPSVAFWHMVDLVWVLVFPVLYLVPR